MIFFINLTSHSKSLESLKFIGEYVYLTRNRGIKKTGIIISYLHAKIVKYFFLKKIGEF